MKHFIFLITVPTRIKQNCSGVGVVNIVCMRQDCSTNTEPEPQLLLLRLLRTENKFPSCGLHLSLRGCDAGLRWNSTNRTKDRNGLNKKRWRHIFHVDVIWSSLIASSRCVLTVSLSAQFHFHFIWFGHLLRFTLCLLSGPSGMLFSERDLCTSLILFWYTLPPTLSCPYGYSLANLLHFS